jgi:hypothetical protein
VSSAASSTRNAHEPWHDASKHNNAGIPGYVRGSEATSNIAVGPKEARLRAGEASQHSYLRGETYGRGVLPSLPPGSGLSHRW